MKLPREFYLRDDVINVSRDLLGKVLCTNLHGQLTRIVITETEAYAGVNDKASHAFGGKRTKRTEPMFGSGGIAYVYLCYGIHHLFNVVTNLLGGPGSLAKALGITTALTGLTLLSKEVWIEDSDIVVEQDAIDASPRVGVDYAGEDALLPYRFRAKTPPAG